MTLALIWACVLLGQAAGRAAEWRIHRKNYQALRAAGADERRAWLMRAYYGALLLVVPAAAAEHWLLEPAADRRLVVAGLVAVLAGQCLRSWAILSLGPLWTMRCLALPGARHRRVGPYRWLENPEYLSRLIDGVGLCLLFGAVLSGLGFVVLVLLVHRRLVAAERAQAGELIFARPSANVPGLGSPSGGLIQ